MKIGIVSNLYPPYVRGGAEYVVVRTVEKLIEQGEDIFVITSCPKERALGLECFRNASERIYYFFPKNLYYLLDDYKHYVPVRLLWHIIDGFSRYGAKNTTEVLKKENPDVVFTHNLKGIGLRIPLAIQKFGTPHIHVVHDLQLIYPSGLLFIGQEKKSILVRPIYSAYQKVCSYLMGQPDLVIFPSEYLRKTYLEKGFFKHSRIRVMQNPAPDNIRSARIYRENKALNLLFIGQLEYHKGIQFLIEAFKKLDIKANLIIAGEGTLRNYVELEAEKNKNITYLGYIAVEQMMECFGAADALVVPSLCYENSPTVIYEALAAGVPVVASEIGGVGELVENGRNGFLFKPEDETDFLRAVHDVVTSRQKFIETQDDIRKTVEPFALDKYAKDLVKHAEDVIAQK
ncbi:hypothetical protein COY25_04550 [Candidatus Uhrbacteria bacterium CG_4_10_14_0_2_um_filter_41_7]|uniref:Glycosyltransferase n=1 Tax=Candidatus Uhrbacteria bacterium CG_4_9_14_3_um_filter_41_35 TaxID=1975034 RepID=A0A2M7XCY2_9BACT|nr:MAG: hypothetical protein COY25_04550 [Candidatus Uhrbacteria bacterium CG_4_10_14_0_2_um_filter_41_7]PJA45737.1 MAG: hypothetical protein CO173_04775 [Candidatus Uhrbacteria bacterium CG_4_9_14_3_um_filter_41_35]